VREVIVVVIVVVTWNKMRNPPLVFGVREWVVVVDAQNKMRKKTPLAFGVREGVHAVIVPIGFVAPLHPVVIVVRFNTYKTLSVEK
jgi:hypothetical protein